MREYAKISPQFWLGETGRQIRALGPECQIVALYLITNPHANMIGLYYLPVTFMAHETGMSEEGASEALRRVSEADFCSYDEGAEVVWVHEMARFQLGDELSAKDKRVAGVERELEKCVKTGLCEAFRRRYAASFRLKPASPFEAPSKPLRSQEQEQEIEQEHKNTLSSPSAPARAGDRPETAGNSRSSVEAVFSEWNATAAGAAGLSGARVLSKGRREKIKTRLSEPGWLSMFREGLAKLPVANDQKFTWQPDLDWLIANDTNAAKLAEGKYDRQAPARSERPLLSREEREESLRRYDAEHGDRHDET